MLLFNDFTIIVELNMHLSAVIEVLPNVGC